MSVYAPALEWAIKIFWPWILQNVWPAIQKMLVDLIVSLVRRLIGKINETFSDTGKKRAKQAKEKAQFAEDLAASASDKDQADIHLARAAIWREVEQQYKSDMEKMNKRISDLEATSLREAHKEVQSLSPELDVGSTQPTLIVGTHTRKLPEIH